MKQARSTGAWIAAAIVAPSLAPPGAAQDWQELGPAPINSSGGYSGRISAIACSATDPNLYYVGGADGGVWKTLDGGATWTPLTDRMPTTSTGAIAVDPTDDRVVYVGTGEANYANHSRYGLGVYRSADGGASWTHLAEETFGGRTFAKLAIDPLDTGTLYAAVGRAGGFPALAAAKGHPGAAGPVGVFKSTDAGASWTHLAGGLPSVEAGDVAIDPSAPATVYAAIGNVFGHAANGIYKSQDAGATWSKLSGGLPSANVGRISIGISPSRPRTLYALFANRADASGGGATNRGGFRSDDGGATWTARGSVDQSTYGWYLSCVSVKPDDPETVFYGGLSMSRYIGASGSTVTPPHVDLHAIAWDAAGRLLVGDDGGVHRSTNLGASWSSLNSGLGTIQFYAGLSTHPTDDRYVLGGAQDNGTNRRTADGKSWGHVLGGDGGWTQLDDSSPSIVFAELQGTANLYRSTDGGASFNFAGSGIGGRNCFLPPYVIDPSNPSTMYYGTERVYRSTNGGLTWSARSADLTDGAGAIRALAIAPTDPNFLYASTNDGNVLVSGDAGQTFTRVLDGHPGWPRVTRELHVDTTDGRTVYLATAAFGVTQIRRSIDGGQNWEALDASLPDIPVNVVAVDRRRSRPVIYAGTDAGLLRSVDDGGSWSRYLGGLPNAPVIDIDLDTGRDRLVVGTQGRGAWTAPIVYCDGDWNGDGAADTLDVLAFLNDWASGDPGADINGDGLVNSLDVLAFLNAWNAGC
ncbi:MAG TPA: GC-type dockerin domain-anchored protein [Phycisphaerales bacterium]|nr:GC-type dockerin domain-anchored protein [Phycisphaerales bacterium]